MNCNQLLLGEGLTKISSPASTKEKQSLPLGEAFIELLWTRPRIIATLSKACMTWSLTVSSLKEELCCLICIGRILRSGCCIFIKIEYILLLLTFLLFSLSLLSYSSVFLYHFELLRNLLNWSKKDKVC